MNKVDRLDKIDYRQILAHYGEHNQMKKAIEECAELIVAISKRMADHINYKKKNLTDVLLRNNLISEMADVSNLISQLQIIENVTDEDLLKEMRLKNERTLQIIKRENS